MYLPGIVYENVLIPTDGSDGMPRAVEHAIRLARTSGGTLHVLHVVDEVLPLDSHSRSLYDELETAGRVSAEAICDRAAEAGVHAVGTVRQGTPSEVILDYADGNDVDLIVMGTHGRTGLPRLLLGSTTERVVRLSDVPVLTVRTLPVAGE